MSGQWQGHVIHNIIAVQESTALCQIWRRVPSLRLCGFHADASPLRSWEILGIVSTASTKNLRCDNMQMQAFRYFTDYCKWKILTSSLLWFFGGSKLRPAASSPLHRAWLAPSASVVSPPPLDVHGMALSSPHFCILLIVPRCPEMVVISCCRKKELLNRRTRALGLMFASLPLTSWDSILSSSM